jgi:hypothetical protein
MAEPHMPELPLLDRVKIQAEVLITLFHACERELGTERARTLFGDALREHYQSQVRDQWDAAGGDLDTFMLDWSRRSGTSEALTVDWKRLDDTHIEFDVTGCKYAEFWRGVGEPELGFLLMCAADYAVADAVDPIHLERTQTRMQGASHCDFRFTLDRD